MKEFKDEMSNFFPSSGTQSLGGPKSPKNFTIWINDIKNWRINTKSDMNYKDTEYERSKTKWASMSFVEAFVMIEDLYIYDTKTNKWTVSKFLDDINSRWGGADRIILWPTFPNLGIDDKNQFDFYRTCPGGIYGIRSLITQFHDQGLKVLIAENSVWDINSNKESGRISDNVVQLCSDVGADGIFGDIQAKNFVFEGIKQTGMHKDWVDSFNEKSYPIALEPEWNSVFSSNYDFIKYNILSWNYSTLSTIPYVSASKWLETRHMDTIANRWRKDRSEDLLAAFFNGIGYDAWENIFAVWNQITNKDAQYIKCIYTILRRYKELLISKDWEPHTPMLQKGVYASKFPFIDQTLWTIINLNTYTLKGEQIDIPYNLEVSYFDLYHGVELKPICINGKARLSFDIEEKGIAAVLMINKSKIPSDHDLFLNQMSKLTANPLNTYSTNWSKAKQTMTIIEKTPLTDIIPESMVFIPGTDNYHFISDSIIREGDLSQKGDKYGADFQFPWENEPDRHHDSIITIHDFYIDKTTVTNAKFKEFMDATKYFPDDSVNFLKHWLDDTYPEGWDEKPVTYVSIEDARIYAIWASKRLLHSWEWQYAAQGEDGRIYPWGDIFDENKLPITVGDCVNSLIADDVNAHPKGASPFGVLDLVGNVWQMTDEFIDEHTRSVCLKGGSKYVHSQFNNTNRVNKHQKYLLMAPCRDRSSMIGFRCAKDNWAKIKEKEL